MLSCMEHDNKGNSYNVYYCNIYKCYACGWIYETEEQWLDRILIGTGEDRFLEYDKKTDDLRREAREKMEKFRRTNNINYAIN